MPNENSSNQNEIASKSSISFVVTDSDGAIAEEKPTGGSNQRHCLPSPPSPPLHHASQPENSVNHTGSLGQGNSDPQKIMRDLPADEFFKVLEESTPEQLQTIIRSFEKGTSTKNGTKWLQRVMSAPKGPRSVLATLLWWEFRRPLYNLAVGLSGLPSVLLLSAFGMGHTAIFAALFYAIFANVCYCLGTPAEMVARACWKDKAENYGPVLLSLGTIFSIVLTIFLELLVCAAFILGSISGRF